jgi:hypothetical protein
MKDHTSPQKVAPKQLQATEGMRSLQPPAFQLKTEQDALQSETPKQKMDNETAGGIIGGLGGAAMGLAAGMMGGIGAGVMGAIGGGLFGYKSGRKAGLASEPMGAFKVDQKNNDAPKAGDGYSSDIKVSFSPNAKKVNSSEIAFVQNVRVIDKATGKSIDPRDNFKNRKTKDEYTIDRLEDKKLGWYGYNNDGTESATISAGSAPSPVKDAVLTDRPQWSVPNTSWDFETTAIAKSGTDAGKIYGAVTWGFAVDAANKLTSHKVAETVKPSTEFNDAVTAWNDQAAGPEAKRNHPDQQALGPFK